MELSMFPLSERKKERALSPCNSRDYIIQITSLSIVYYCYCTVSNPNSTPSP